MDRVHLAEQMSFVASAWTAEHWVIALVLPEPLYEPCSYQFWLLARACLLDEAAILRHFRPKHGTTKYHRCWFILV